MARTAPKAVTHPAIIVFALAIVGIASIGYVLFDLKVPNHFVGDMYGFEVISRLVFLVPAVFLMFLGMLLFLMGSKRTSKSLGRAGITVTAISACILVLMAARTSWSRRQWEIRESYPSRSTEELLRIGREEKDQFAIEALLLKKDPAAVPGLCEILLDESEWIVLRIEAAHALGEIGGEQARETLEQVQASNPPEHLMIAVEYSLETRMGLPNKFRLKSSHAEPTGPQE